MQSGGHLAHLRHATRRALQPVRVERLDRIDHDNVGLDLFDPVENRLGRRLGEHQHIFSRLGEPLGAQFDLVRRFLAGDVEHPVAATSEPCRHLEQQGRLTDARLAAQQDERARDHAAPQHEVELGQADAPARALDPRHLGERDGPRLGARRAIDPIGGGGRPNPLLHKRVPRLAVRATPLPTVRLAAALCAEEDSAKLRH